ncbi:MAG: SIMPL domain-containing protein [bacterium]
MNTTHVSAQRLGVALVSVLLLLAAATPAFASGASESARTITVVGEGEVTAEPDQATVTLGVQLFDESAQAASSELRSRMESVIDALRALGIPERRIQTRNYSIFFERDHQTPLSGAQEGRPAGIYRVENTVRVVIDDVSSAAGVVEAAIGAGANQMYGIAFSLSEPGAIEAQAREAAMADARQRARTLAAAEGLDVGRAVEISEVVGGAAAYEGQAPAMGRGGGPIEPGSTRYTARVEVTYELE